MEVTRHVRRRHGGGCFCCSSAYELEDEYPAVLQVTAALRITHTHTHATYTNTNTQRPPPKKRKTNRIFRVFFPDFSSKNRVTVDEWNIALHDLNHIVHRYGPSPGLWSLLLLLAFLPLIILIPVLLNMNGGSADFWQVWIWIMVGQFFLWMSVSIALVARNRRFIHALDHKVEEINHAWHARGVTLRMCHHHHHGYSRRFHHAELVVVVQGVQVVTASYQSPLVMHPQPPVYGAPMLVPQAQHGMPPPPGYAMPPGYAPVPTGPTFQSAPPPGATIEMPPPGYFEKGPAPPAYDGKGSDFN